MDWWIVGLMQGPSCLALINPSIHHSNNPVSAWSPRLVSRQRLLGFSEALICLSYSGWLNEEERMKMENRPAGRAVIHSTFPHSALCMLHSTLKWSSRQVMLLRLPVIGRALCF